MWELGMRTKVSQLNSSPDSVESTSCLAVSYHIWPFVPHPPSLPLSTLQICKPPDQQRDHRVEPANRRRAEVPRAPPPASCQSGLGALRPATAAHHPGEHQGEGHPRHLARQLLRPAGPEQRIVRMVSTETPQQTTLKGGGHLLMKC